MEYKITGKYNFIIYHQLGCSHVFLQLSRHSDTLSSVSGNIAICLCSMDIRVVVFGFLLSGITVQHASCSRSEKRCFTYLSSFLFVHLRKPNLDTHTPLKPEWLLLDYMFTFHFTMRIAHLLSICTLLGMFKGFFTPD